MRNPFAAIPPLSVILLATLAAASTSPAQHLNIDLGVEHGPPPSSYGGAAGQAGFWNHFGPGLYAVADLSGQPTSVFVDVLAPHVGWAGLSAGDGAYLFGDNLLDCTDPDRWEVEFTGLIDGLYDVYLYAPENSVVSLGDSAAGGVAAPSVPGDQPVAIPGVTLQRVPAVATAGRLVVAADATREPDCAGLAGIQLRHRGPAPAPTTFFNIDLGRALGVPSLAYPAGGAPGAWNALGLGSHQLVDRHGVPSGVTLDVVAVTDSGAGTPGPGGDGERLFGDNIFGCGEEWALILSGLPDDLYRVDLYAPSNSVVSTGDILLNAAAVASVAGGPMEPVAGSSWVSLEIEVLGSVLSITGLSPTGGCAGLAGLQIGPTFLFLDGFESGDSTRWAPGSP